MILRAVEVAQLIKGQRKKLNITQDQLTKKLGWKCRNSQNISNIERGLCQIPSKWIIRLSESLCVNPSEITDAMVSDYKLAIVTEALELRVSSQNG